MAVTRDQALCAVTIDAARRIRRGDRVGSLEPGKQADLSGALWRENLVGVCRSGASVTAKDVRV